MLLINNILDNCSNRLQKEFSLIKKRYILLACGIKVPNSQLRAPRQVKNREQFGQIPQLRGPHFGFFTKPLSQYI